MFELFIFNMMIDIILLLFYLFYQFLLHFLLFLPPYQLSLLFYFYNSSCFISNNLSLSSTTYIFITICLQVILYYIMCSIKNFQQYISILSSPGLCAIVVIHHIYIFYFCFTQSFIIYRDLEKKLSYIYLHSFYLCCSSLLCINSYFYLVLFFFCLTHFHLHVLQYTSVGEFFSFYESEKVFIVLYFLNVLSLVTYFQIDRFYPVRQSYC